MNTVWPTQAGENHSGKNKKQCHQYLHVQYDESQKYYDKVWDGLGDRGWHTYTTMHKVVTNEAYCGDLNAKGIQEGMYVYTWLILFATQQKRTWHCKVTILLLKNKNKNTMPSEREKKSTHCIFCL